MSNIEFEGEVPFENEKLDSFLKILSNYIEKTNLEIKTKGDLLFKIFISLGLVLAIVLWWFMGISVLFKIAAIGILTIVISQLFQHQGKGDLATLSSLAGLVIVLAIVLSMVSDLFGSIKTLFELY